MSDVWEEGYALKDLSKRQAMLLERKEELESRKKKAQTLRRAALKRLHDNTTNNNNNNNSNSNGNHYDQDVFVDGMLLPNPSSLSALSSLSTATTTTVASSSTTSITTLVDRDNIDVDLDLIVETEVIKCHVEQLKRDEMILAEERRLLESEKAIHQKELKRCQCEERSRFYKDLPVLHERYMLQSMLGRGGFSEVWKALDLVDLREVSKYR
jgi:hypothetical protein